MSLGGRGKHRRGVEGRVGARKYLYTCAVGANDRKRLRFYVCASKYLRWIGV